VSGLNLANYDFLNVLLFFSGLQKEKDEIESRFEKERQIMKQELKVAQKENVRMFIYLFFFKFLISSTSTIN
jgi:hypothetical protein